MSDLNLGIQMVLKPGSKPTREYKQTINGLGKLGREIKLSPKACVTVNGPGFCADFKVDTVSINIGIGPNHTADLVMTTEAWEALKAGAEVNVHTVQQMKKILGL